MFNVRRVEIVHRNMEDNADSTAAGSISLDSSEVVFPVHWAMRVEEVLRP